MPRKRPVGLVDQVFAELVDAGEALPLSEIKFRLRDVFSDHWVGVAVAELVEQGQVTKGMAIFRKVLPKRQRDQVQEYRATVYAAIPLIS